MQLNSLCQSNALAAPWPNVKLLSKPSRLHSSVRKMLLCMKVTAILLMVFCLQVSASTMAQSVSLSETKAPLTKVLSKIRQQTGYLFFYNDDWMQKAQPVDIQVKNAGLNEVLTSIFNKQPFTYEIVDKTISLKLKTTEKHVAVPVAVSGKVSDTTGATLAGASVSILSTQTGTLTDANGYFKINANSGDHLMISFIGFKSYIFPVTPGMAFQNIVLHALSGNLQEVRVTVSNGYQTIAKERSAGSFAKPDMKTIDNRSNSMNILQRIDGLVPGLAVNNAPGQSQYLIRGATTVSTNTSPLFVVDGIPQPDLTYINPQDVADITVLKDATSASIWGARAANGVIVINTKKGQIGEKLKVSYDAFANFQGKPNINYFPVLNSQQFIQAARETFDPVAFPYANVSTYPNATAGLAPHEVILYNQLQGKITTAQANSSLDSLAGISNNKQIKDLFYRNALLMNHTVSVSGGQKNYAIYSSLAYTDNQSYSPGQSDNTYKINVRQNFQIGSRVQLGLITDLSNQVTSSQRNISPTDQFYPYQLFKDNSGNNISMPWMTSLNDAQRIDFQNRSRVDLDYNPLNEINLGYNKNDILNSRNIFTANVKLIDGLTFDGTYGYSKGTSRTRDFSDQNSYLVRAQLVQFTVAPTAASTPVYYLPSSGGNYGLTNLNTRNWTVRNQFTYNKNWENRKHQLTLLAGQEAQEQYSVTNFSFARGWDPQLQNAGATFVDYKTLSSTGIAGTVYPNSGTSSRLSDSPFTQAELLSRYTSYYANAAYTFNYKYTINGSWRIDQSNNFGLDKSAQNKPVWSIGGKWMASEEAFLKKVIWLDNLDLRATYGLTGNAPPPGTAASYDILSADGSTFLPNSKGLGITTPANRKLTWERTATINLGLDFALLKGRITGALDVYSKKTTNLLGNVTTNIFTGYASVLGNLGDLQNKGIELSLTSVNIKNKDFSWSTTLNGSYNRNTITKLNVAAPITTGSTLVDTHFLAGYSAYALFAYQFAGLDNLGDPQVRLADGTVTKTRNVTKPADIKYMGTVQPPWSGGFNNSFQYKSFGLSFNAVFNFGNVMRRDVDNFFSGRLSHFSALGGGFTSGNVNAEFADRWKQPGDELTTNVPSFVANNTTNTTRRDIYYYVNGDLNVVSAAFVKMRDITFTYSLPQLVAKKISADQITLRAQLSNLMVWRGNKYGIDPEFQSNYLGTRTLPFGQNTVTLGLNVRF